MLLRLALKRGNDLLQVAHQESCWMYEESASVLWMAGSPAAQEGTISPEHPFSAQLDRQMLARPLAYFVGTLLVLVPPLADTLLQFLSQRGAFLAHPLPLQTVVPGHTSERESVVLLVLNPTLVRLIWSESQPSGHHLQVKLPPGNTQRQYIRLAPSVGTGQRMYFT
jgi:hypothetical protein